MNTSASPLPGLADPARGPAAVTLNRHMRRALAKNPAALTGGGGQRGFRVSRRGFPAALAPGGAPAAAGPVTPAAAAPRGRPGPGADLTLAPASFTEISSRLQFGPPTDISAGWDGTLWSIDTSGAPHRYDPLTDTWSPQDTGVDAVAAFGWPGVIYHFRGDSFLTVTGGVNQVQGPPAKIAATWPGLPHSFTQGVTGAANVNGDLYLFRGGLYAVAQKSGPPPVPGKLTDLAGWPQAPAWKDGVIDAVSSDASGQSSKVQLYRGDEVLSVDMAKRQVLGPSQSLSDIGPWQGHVPADWLASGIDTGYYYTSSSGAWTALYRGTAMIFFKTADSGAAVPQYLPTVFRGWPAVWNPVLANAPSGRAGALSSAASDGTVLRHDGTAWAALPALPGSGQALSVSVGRDGTVYAATAAAVHRLDGMTWSPGTTPGRQLAQVAVGDSSRVWVRGASNTVYRLNASGSGFTPATLLGSATHLSANADGTVWHCHDDPNAYRFISEGTEAPEPIPLGTGTTAVRKVASTGFGNSFCLAGPPGVGSAQGGGGQLFAYQSNYQFKTSQSYNAIGSGAIAEGAGMIFLIVDEDKAGQAGSAIVGLDAQTGDQRFLWSPGASGANVTLTNPVYDPVNQVLYVGTSSGVLYALDVRTQKPVWSYPVPGGAGIGAAPALAGSNLCFGDSDGYLYKIDTGQAAAAGPAAPTPAWRCDARFGGSITQVKVATPLIQNGEAIFVTWAAAASSTQIVVTRRNLADGTERSLEVTMLVSAPVSHFASCPPVAGAIKGDSGAAVPAVFVNASDRIIAIYADSDGQGWATKIYLLTDANRFTSGMVFDKASGVLWVGDAIGRLFGLGPALTPVANTPAEPHGGDSIWTTPVVYTDSAGATSVLFGTSGPGSTELWVFDPTRPAGDANPVSVATGQTRVSQLSASISNGVVYAAGATYWQGAGAAAGQVFAINIDRAVQALRDVIVESQLMQDFDEPPAGQAEPPTFARYQTHLTVVDDLKAPRPFEAVKVWADRATTVSINGATPVSIGPGDDDFAAAQTGLDGAVTIASGYLTAHGSDETDLFAAPLRVWAGFMDPYERVVVYPDREFHGRLAAARAVTDASDPGYDNPDVVNLQTVQTYSGATLFASAEQNSGQPQNVASAIHTMARSVPISAGGQAPAAAAGGPGDGPPGSPPLGAPPGKYLAYPDLPGGAFSPVNVAATRTAVVAAPAGLRFVSNDGSAPPSFSVLSHADATIAIDALDGQEWTPSGLAGVPVLGSFFSSFWDFIKHAAAAITHIVVSIGKEIYAGIRFIANGVAYFFKHPLQTLEDVVSAIGTFFQKLAKLIKNVVEAVSILFHLDEIVKTHTLLRDELLARVNGDSTGTGGYADLIKNHVIPDIDAFFYKGETKIKTALDDFKALAQGGSIPSKISTQPKASSTPSTLFNVAPLNKSAPASSHSVACMWALHKTQAGQQQVSFLGGSTGASAPSLPALLQKNINEFTGRLADDGDLHTDLENIQSDLHNLFSATSFAQFAEQGLATLIDVVELVLAGVLNITNAFIDELLGAVADLITYLFGDKTTPGLLNEPIHIPVLSALYQQAFREDLTVLNLAMLVAAIPVTIVYRVLAGLYPSQDVQTKPREALRNAFGILGGFATLCAGVANASADWLATVTAGGEGTEGGDLGPVAKLSGILGLCAGMVLAGATEPNVTAESPEPNDWVIWGVGFAPLFAALITMAVGGKFQKAGEVLDIVSSVVLAASSIAVVIVAAVAFSEKKQPTNVDELALASLILLAAPGIVNPVKYVTEYYIGLVVGALDYWGSLGSAGCLFAATALEWDNEIG